MIATVHATESGRNHGIHNDLQRYIHEAEYWLTYEAWRVIVCTDFMKNEVNKYFNCPGDKVDVIYNGVNAKKFRFEWTEAERQAWRSKLANPDEKIIMYVGRFVREKGIHVLLNAASVVLANEPKSKFVIVGGGNRTALERFVRWAGLQDKVLFTGFMAGQSLLQLYRSADVAVFPSLYEPFGIVALEGMAAGAAVVASDAGGLKEVVLHEKTGLTHFAGKPESLAWAIIHALRHPEQTAEYKVAANKRLDTDFDWGRIADQTIEVYNRVWAEFLGSYWADRTLWPISEGARERAELLRVKEKAQTGAYVARPMPNVSVPNVKLHPEEALHPGKKEDDEVPESGGALSNQS
jgi:glycosyltransferase involved in cell wall biosynthesis